MEAIVIAVVILGVTGLAMGLFLAFAAKKFEVQIDPKIEEIIGILPGANCGGCGYPGCSGYASAIVEEGAAMTLCSPGGASVAAKIGDIMGASVDTSGEKVVARVLCQGDNTFSKKRFDFDGELKTCSAVTLYAGGDKSCKYGCLGYGDCERVCPVGAIVVNEKGIASVDEEACISCGLCVKACPKSVIAMTPAAKKVTVKCMSKDKGGDAKKACGIACIGCGMCQRTCPFGAIEVSNNLAKIDPAKCKNCQLCVVVCPTKAIYTGLNRPLPKKPEPKKPAPKPAAPKPEAATSATEVKKAVEVEKAVKTEEKVEAVKATTEKAEV
ncbi:RnfABCDGE type electron transport complex subunit B [Fusobacterium necrophorum subsp. funduliforme]|uniref:Ion-translocating oxidoreductase complex subunit B n=1 Tax=Fusobacterium necrophorum subsp. funduliforme B35 TaxID=1226633 RepID=A0A017H2T1_9FUSO|nr:RnfABCDGE type electron transport complex subunit B [Fusobacterium necrophorum]EHO16246.1 electron transport complex, rnfabcdge type, b subunit [Fusobacterium necrophorum subsp. funduliforme 1_1_36S]AVQ20441.1 RnfABCDGE type electron transport complex subunit B [Fusobacterium necrophorum subsp. funduliforme]EYD68590.1 RnfABCDGE type electron transport complex subunit B [Fusobacterium necrophorum subsp. funduliforme B35]KID48027.1 electron transporter RnfB [Fusobacterium necrophorum subsp. fu